MLITELIGAVQHAQFSIDRAGFDFLQAVSDVELHLFGSQLRRFDVAQPWVQNRFHFQGCDVCLGDSSEVVIFEHHL
jgi:hypothetical protein